MPPQVSVRVITYNHEKFIAQCLEGILMQRTNFPFEVIVGEDCSTDHTREIVLAYGNKYPKTIRVITSESNVGAIQNNIRVQQACWGKYHAFCEGDDFWIDPLKLQKQVDWMEAHLEYSMCFHDAFKVRNDKSAMPDYCCQPALPERLTTGDLLRLDPAIPTASILARGELLASLPGWSKDIIYSDRLLRLWCSHQGDLGYLREVMSVYRIHPGGLIMSNQSLDVHYSRVTDIYRRFNEETAYQYTDLIEQAISKTKKKIRYERMRKKFGRFGFLLRPEKAIERVRIYANLIKRHNEMYSR